jgi:hypothetical protein
MIWAGRFNCFAQSHDKVINAPHIQAKLVLHLFLNYKTSFESFQLLLLQL